MFDGLTCLWSFDVIMACILKWILNSLLNTFADRH